MVNNKEVVFGNRSTFGIRYVPGQIYPYASNPQSYYVTAYLHLILGNQIIGNKNEFCMTGTWIGAINHTLRQLMQNFDSIKHPKFNNFTRDDEIFELIWKANRLENQYIPEYDYLPVLDNSIWSSCHISIDETTDAWLITMHECQGKIKFIWKGWRSPCPIRKIGKLYSVMVEKNFVINTIKECVDYVENDQTSL
jgi:hypothetical protein